MEKGHQKIIIQFGRSQFMSKQPANLKKKSPKKVPKQIIKKKVEYENWHQKNIYLVWQIAINCLCSL